MRPYKRKHGWTVPSPILTAENPAMKAMSERIERLESAVHRLRRRWIPAEPRGWAYYDVDGVKLGRVYDPYKRGEYRAYIIRNDLEPGRQAGVVTRLESEHTDTGNVAALMADVEGEWVRIDRGQNRNPVPRPYSEVSR